MCLSLVGILRKKKWRAPRAAIASLQCDGIPIPSKLSDKAAKLQFLLEKLSTLRSANIARRKDIIILMGLARDSAGVSHFIFKLIQLCLKHDLEQFTPKYLHLVLDSFQEVDTAIDDQLVKTCTEDLQVVALNAEITNLITTAGDDSSSVVSSCDDVENYNLIYCEVNDDGGKASSGILSNYIKKEK